jgi:major membrane immunogen (membrane-anchored lipoprotein)
MSARFARALLTALSISALALAGCGGDDDEDTTSPTGPTGTGNTGGGTSINAGNIATVQATLTQVFTKTIAQGPGTHSGAVSGTVTITLSTGKLAQTTLKYKEVFDNYSDDGLLYIDGTLNVEGSLVTQVFKYTGDLDLSGAYSANVKLDLTLTNGAVSGTVTVDGVPIPVSG